MAFKNLVINNFFIKKTLKIHFFRFLENLKNPDFRLTVTAENCLLV